MNERIQAELLSLIKIAAKQNGDSLGCVSCGDITPRIEHGYQFTAKQVIHVRQKICEPCSVERFEGGGLRG